MADASTSSNVPSTINSSAVRLQLATENGKMCVTRALHSKLLYGF
jgi:hypothetical protein